MVLAEEQNSEFPKKFFGEYLFVFVEYLCNRSPKIKTKNIKNYSSILAIVNDRNWLDDSPPLTMERTIRFTSVLIKMTLNDVHDYWLVAYINTVNKHLLISVKNTTKQYRYKIDFYSRRFELPYCSSH